MRMNASNKHEIDGSKYKRKENLQYAKGKGELRPYRTTSVSKRFS